MKLQTPSQTVGPYFAYGLTSEQYGYNFKQLVGNQMIDEFVDAESITIAGQIFDGNLDLIPDAMIELWDSENKLFGRFGTGTHPENKYIFKTKKPKSIDGQAPFLNVILFMRGQLIHCYTRIYFSDEDTSNSTDVILQQIPKERISTLIAAKKDGFYEFNIYMQGENETVFFDI